ncbi:FAD/NAD(P)-binding domain-containing protein [Gloeopeniophorella convolvens]|nr:FAD/NAD(P)-binding domain-containing protein [Gloeopeniophorella convolvens]
MRVAVVGSGVTGLAATWILNEYSDHEVHLYEATDRPGGHAHTVHATPPGKEPADVDTCVIAFNKPAYPNFSKFLELHPAVKILTTCVTFSVSRDDDTTTWSGSGLGALIRQPQRLFNFSTWRVMYDVMRFNVCAVSVLTEEEDPSIGEYLAREGYSARFRDDYFIPMAAAVWSTPPDVCVDNFPAKALIRYLYNHDLLRFIYDYNISHIGKPPWLTLKNGSINYVKEILNKLPKDRLHLSSPIASVTSADDGLTLEFVSGARETFDHVIFACHSEDSLKLLEAGKCATAEERKVLGAFRWSRNEVWLHSDESLMPRSRHTWSSWNYLTKSAVDTDGVKQASSPGVCLTYWMNHLQHLDPETYGQLLVTLNPSSPPAASAVLGHYSFSHPIIDGAAVRAQAKLADLNASALGPRRRAFAGGWTRCGFHEDGFRTGMGAACALPDVRPPFALMDVEAEGGGPRASAVGTTVFGALETLRVLLATLIAALLQAVNIRGTGAKKVE